MKGVDVSEHNGLVDYEALKQAGIQFVMVRTGFGVSYEDPNFVENVNAAHEHRMLVGAYHYSYALTPQRAEQEAIFVRKMIEDSGVGLEFPVFFDMEDADGYKSRHSFDFSRANITAICKAWMEYIQPLHTGVYASMSWLENWIDWKALGCPVWNAQWGSEDYIQAFMWQFTDNLVIDGRQFDGNIIYDKVHQAGLNPWNA